MGFIRLLKPIHSKDGPIGVAVSGGADSMAALGFLMSYPKNDITVYHVDHGTEFGKLGREFVSDFCYRNNIKLRIHTITNSKPKDESWEEFWRNERLGFFHSVDSNVITGHNLDDVIETWIFSSLHGTPNLIPYTNRNIIRPFMLNSKQTLEEFCRKKGIEWVDDPSNADTNYSRNQIRHRIIPECLKVNPGLPKVIAKKLLESVK